MKTAGICRRRPDGGVRRALTLALVALATGCGAEPADDATLTPVRRLVEVAGDAPLTGSLPIATILDDTRFALAAPREEILVWPREVPLHRGQRIARLAPALPEALAHSRRLLVVARAKIGPEWIQRPPEVVSTVRGDRSTTVHLEIPLPEVPDDTPVTVGATAFPLDLVDLAEQRSEPVAIPDRAWLEFAIGLLLARWGRDPVEFSIEACAAERCDRVFVEVFDPSDGEGWRERRVSLADLAGQTRRLRFLARRLAQEAPFSLPIWANPTVYREVPLRADRPNVILLSVDTLRADHLETYGYSRETAPFVAERFGRGGTVFENPVAAATITTPSHASMFTSLQPAAHGTTDGMKAIPQRIPTLPEWLRAAGVQTAAITEDGWLGIQHGFGRGFDVFVENKSPDIMNPTGQVDLTFARAADWLESNRHKRFFLFLHTFQVHTPYAPPPRYAELFAAASDEPRSAPLRSMDDYDREIRYTDDELRRLFERLRALDLASRTVFVLTADHGEAFLEHGLLQHGGRLHEEVVRVPLLLAGPGIPPGRRITTPVAHVDLLPTILDLFGLPAPAWSEGRSLMGLVSGRENDADFSGRALFSETRTATALTGDGGVVDFPAPSFMVRRGSRKLLRYPDGTGGFRYELYDVASDPEERLDLFPSGAASDVELRELLDGYEARSEQRRAAIGGPALSPAPHAESVPLDPAQEQKLRALGYLE